jgi:hypothetical protein
LLLKVVSVTVSELPTWLKMPPPEVEQLWRQKNDLAAVAETLRADGALSEPLRQAALREVLRRALPPEAAPGNPHAPP